jgi:hypothetical protein
MRCAVHARVARRTGWPAAVDVRLSAVEHVIDTRWRRALFHRVAYAGDAIRVSTAGLAHQTGIAIAAATVDVGLATGRVEHTVDAVQKNTLTSIAAALTLAAHGEGHAGGSVDALHADPLAVANVASATARFLERIFADDAPGRACIEGARIAVVESVVVVIFGGDVASTVTNLPTAVARELRGGSVFSAPIGLTAQVVIADARRTRSFVPGTIRWRLALDGGTPASRSAALRFASLR